MATRSYVPLSSLRAFGAAARHLGFIHATIELNVMHSAISQHIKALEQQLNCQLFVRGPRGLILTTEGESLLPVLNDSFDRMARILDRFATEHAQEKPKVGVMGTFAVGCLLPLLGDSKRSYPHVDLYISIHNNRMGPIAEGLDYTIRYGRGVWHDTDAQYLCGALMSPPCPPASVSQIQTPADILKLPLLRPYRQDERTLQMQAAGEVPPSLTHNVAVFDSSVTMLEAAQVEISVATTPVRVFTHLLSGERAVQPFLTQIGLGNYWIIRLQSCPETPMMRKSFRWLAEVLRK